MCSHRVKIGPQLWRPGIESHELIYEPQVAAFLYNYYVRLQCV
jgi:hypothetical protein